jgi:hypothetical protein
MMHELKKLDIRKKKEGKCIDVAHSWPFELAKISITVAIGDTGTEFVLKGKLSTRAIVFARKGCCSFFGFYFACKLGAVAKGEIPHRIPSLGCGYNSA